jgi:hypothetical protein
LGGEEFSLTSWLSLRAASRGAEKWSERRNLFFLLIAQEVTGLAV